MRRVVWFVGGVAAGAAGVGYAKRKVTADGAQAGAGERRHGRRGSVRRRRRRVADAVRAVGRPPGRERELRAERDGRLVRLGDHLHPATRCSSTASRSSPAGSS